MKEKVKEKIVQIKERLINFEDLAPDSDSFLNTSRKEAEKKGFFARDFGMEQWDWPQGVAIFGLHQAGNEYHDYITSWAKTEIEKGLPTKNVNTVCPMLTLTEFSEFDSLCREWMDWLENEFPRTEENALQHITSGIDKYTVKENKQQIWADTLFMTILFMAKMGIKYDKQEWIDDATYQVLVHVKYLLDREEKLFYHGWNFSEKSNYGGIFWCRGNSWLAIGIPLFLMIVGEKVSSPIRKYLLKVYQNQVAELTRLRGGNHLWHTVLDQPESYTETSGSAGIMAGILIGKNQGYLNDSVSDKFITESIEALLKMVDEQGVVQGVSAGTAISSDKEDYYGIIQTPMVYGQALMLIALEEYLTYLKREFVDG